MPGRSALLKLTAANRSTPRNNAGGPLPALAFAPTGYGQSASSRGHVVADNADAATQTRTYRTFFDLVDPGSRKFRLVFNNAHPGNSSGATLDAAAYNALTVSAAVEDSTGTIIPVTVGGASSWTVPVTGAPIISDPVTITAQVNAVQNIDSASYPGMWIRTYVSLPAADSHAGCATTSGSSVITDPSITSAHAGRAVTGTGIPANARVGTVTAGASFVLMNAALGATVNASATNASVTLTLPQITPLNLWSLYTGDGATTGTTGANLTTAGSGTVTANSGIALYGPAVLLAPATKARQVLTVSDSIYDGYSEAFNTTWNGPVARACRALGLGHVKFSRGGESAGGFSFPVTGSQIRRQYATGCTDAIIEIGTNDGQLTTATTALTLENYLANMVSWLQSVGVKRIALATIPPRTTSTDSFATLANQTPLASASIAGLAAINAWIRAKPAGVTQVIDLADRCMSARDSGLWAVTGASNGHTSDGVHPVSADMLGGITSDVQAALAAMAP